MVTSVLSPLQLTVMDGLLNNQGLGVNANLVASVNSYNTTTLITPLLQAITLGSAGNILQPATLTALQSIGSTACAALGDSIPSGYTGVVSLSTSNPGFINAVETFAELEAGNGDVTKFIQAFYAAQAFAQQTNDFILSAVNANTYLGGTFTNTNDQITGYITATTTDMPAFADDLAKLGNLIDLNNLDNLGLPSALIRQISTISGGVPSISPILADNGVDVVVVANLNDPKATFTDTVEKQLYTAMQFVTGDALAQVLQVLGVTTPGITTMADLLDITKILPTSYPSLTVPVAAGLANIYVPNTSSVNTQLADQLPPYVVSSVI